MKIVINDCSRLLFAGRVMLKPGTNVLDEFDEKKYSSWIDCGYIRVVDAAKATDSEKRETVKKSYDRATLVAIENAFGEKVSDDAARQKEVLDKEEKEFEKQVAEYRAKKGKKG